MERNTFKVVFFCKKMKVNKKGKAPIYVRITIDGVSTEIFTKCQIEPEHWNKGLSPFNPESMAIEAERLMLQRMDDPLAYKRSLLMSELEIQLMQEKIDAGILLAQKRLIEKAKKEDAELVVEKDGKVVRIKVKDLK